MNKTSKNSTAITISLPRWARTHYEALADANGLGLATLLRLTLLYNVIASKDVEQEFADLLKRRLASRNKG